MRLTDEQMKAIRQSARQIGNAIPDAWIAAAAQSHRVHLVTFDKGFRRLMKASLVTVLRLATK